MSAVDLSAASEYLKTRYYPKKITEMSFGKSACLAMLPKQEDFGGENLKLPVGYADLKGRSASFPVAIANKAGSETAAFFITTVENFGVFSIKGRTIKQSKGKADAWLPALEKESDSALRALGRSASINVFRRSVGDIGTTTTTSGTTLTLGNRAQVNNFEVGMSIYFANSSSPFALRDNGETVSITAIDRAAGTFTVSADLSGISGLTSGDLIIPEGDHNSMMSGFQDWGPSSLTSSSFFGQDRTLDAGRLAMQVYSVAGATPIEALNEAATRQAENDATPSHFFCPFSFWRDLNNQLGPQRQYVTGAAYTGSGGPKAEVFFQGLRVIGPTGPIDVYGDRHCPPGEGYMLQMDTWNLHTAGKLPMLLEEDGQTILREALDDAYEGRWGYYGQLYSNAPGYNARLTNLGG